MIAVSEMRDGIITFESEGDAQRFSAMLEADGHLEASDTGSVLTHTIGVCAHFAALHDGTYRIDDTGARTAGRMNCGNNVCVPRGISTCCCPSLPEQCKQLTTPFVF